MSQHEAQVRASVGGFRALLRVDPVPRLLHSADPRARLLVKREVLRLDVGGEIEELRDRLAPVAAPGVAGIATALHAAAMLGMSRRDPDIAPLVDRALEWLADLEPVAFLDVQREVALVLASLCRLGAEDEPRVEHAFQRLESAVRPDGGLTSGAPIRARLGDDVDLVSASADPMLPSDLPTTREAALAFAASPRRRRRHVVRCIVDFLLAHVGDQGRPDEFDRDVRRDLAPPLHRDLEAIAALPFSPEDPRVLEGMRWLIERQRADGSWEGDDLLTVRALITLRRFHETEREC
jgi:hypothetical protein